MKLFKWQKGRADTGYLLFPLIWSVKFKCDAYLIKYPISSYIPEHTDAVKKRKHYRLNIVLKRAKRGGLYIGESRWSALNDRIMVLRPDVDVHAVSKIEDGSRWVFSVGFTV